MRTRNLEKEASIRKQALAIIAAEGLENLSMQKLAKAAGVSPRTIYIKYKDKEDLLVTLFVDDVLSAYEAALLEGFDSQMSFASGVERLWYNAWNYFRQHREAFALMQYGKSSPLLNQAYRERNIEEGMYFTPIHGWLDFQAGLGVLPKLPMAAYRALLFAPLLDIIGEYIEHLDRPEQLITEALFSTCLQTTIKGIQL